LDVVDLDVLCSVIAQTKIITHKKAVNHDGFFVSAIP